MYLWENIRHSSSVSNFGECRPVINMGLTLTEKSLKLIITLCVPLKRQVLHEHLSDAFSIQESLEMCKPWESRTAPACLYSLDLPVGHCPHHWLYSFEINFTPFPPAPNQVQNLYPTSWPWGRNAPRWALLTLQHILPRLLTSLETLFLPKGNNDLQ